jgi:hypothetical protein
MTREECTSYSLHICCSSPLAFKHLRTRWRLSSFFVRLGSPLDALSLGAPPPCTGQPRLHPPGFLLFSSPCLARAAWLSSARRAWPSDALPVCVCAAGRLTASSRRRAHPAIYSSTSSPGLGAPADRLARARLHVHSTAASPAARCCIIAANALRTLRTCAHLRMSCVRTPQPRRKRALAVCDLQRQAPIVPSSASMPDINR